MIQPLDLYKNIKDLFLSEKLLKEVNHAIIAFIPKVGNPKKIGHYSHISLCNTYLQIYF